MYNISWLSYHSVSNLATVVLSINKDKHFSFIPQTSNNNNNNNQNLNLQTSSNTLLTSNINVANQINVMNMLGKRKRRKKREIATLAKKGIEALKTFSDEVGQYLIWRTIYATSLWNNNFLRFDNMSCKNW